LCRRPPFGPDSHQQFGAHLVEESKTTWRGPVRQAPKPQRLRRRSLRSHRNPPTRRLRPFSLRRGPVLGRALRRSSTPLRGCSRSASRGWGLRRKTLRLSEGSGPSSQASPCRLSLSRRRAHPRRKRSHPNTRTRFHPTPLPTPSTSTSGRPSATSLYCKARLLARRRRSKSLLRRLHQHRRLPRMLRRRPSGTPGTPYRPCRLS
jgi:hypothetical protein